MEDSKIIDLFSARDEHAVRECENKYKQLILSVAKNILRNNEDAEECANEVLLKLWNSIPPARPQNFIAYIVKITRNTALHMVSYRQAMKRQNDYFSEIYEELSEMIPSGFNVENEIEKQELMAFINEYVKKLDKDARRVFTGRFFFMETLDTISKKTGLSVKKVRNISERCRKELAERLKREGFV